MLWGFDQQLEFRDERCAIATNKKSPVKNLTGTKQKTNTMNKHYSLVRADGKKGEKSPPNEPGAT